MPGWYSPLQASAKPVQSRLCPRGSQHPLGLAGDPSPPVDQGPEYVKKHRPNGGHSDVLAALFSGCQKAPD